MDNFVGANSLPPAGPPVRYRFGLFELDLSARRLVKQGHEVRVQDQPFQLLVALVERNGEIVTREDLRQRLWAGNTFVDFDKSLGVALTKLRDALGDSAASPTYIETVARHGYRFIAPVERNGTLAAQPISAIAETAEVPNQPPAVAERALPVIRVTLALVLIMAVSGGLYWYYRLRPKLGQHAAIMVGRFVNLTGDAAFDGSLEQASVVELSQSPFLTILPRKALRDGLQNLGRSPDEALSPSLERQICQRANAAALVTGSIHHSGNTYVLSLEADACSDGGVLATERVTLSRKEDVLPGIDRAVASLRRKFGESGESLQKHSMPVEQATTDSLEALKAYQLGLDLRSRGKNQEAIPVFKSAIALDDKFAMAYAQLGSSYSNQGETEEGAKYFRKAFELRSRTIEPERLYIAGRYFDIVTGELEKAMETYRLWSDSYPNEWRPLNTLANDALLLGRYEEAIDASRQALKLNPDQAFNYEILAGALLALNHMDEAKSVARQAVSHARDDGGLHLLLFAVAVLQSDPTALEEERKWSAEFPDDSSVPYGEAEYAAARGQMKRSADLFEKIAQQQIEAGLPGYAANLYADEAFMQLQMGQPEEAIKSAQKSLKSGKTDINLGVVAAVFAWNGDSNRATAVKREFDSEYPISTYNMGIFSPMITAGDAIHRGRPAQEIKELMAPAGLYETGGIASLNPIYIRAVGYLEGGAPQDALSEFQKLLDHRGVDPLRPSVPLAILGIARASARLGKIEDARKAYENVLEYWKDADPGLPIVIQTRLDYGQILKRRGQ
jgi:tetratricopeptide (TPR) repeat protein/DNA-binding winged helix-turn-helix (wHTH) protein